MIATLLDTKTGETRVVSGHSSWSWAEGNRSCDCNREIEFGIESSNRFCLGCKRFLVIDAIFNFPEDDLYDLKELNEGYPEELYGLK